MKVVLDTNVIISAFIASGPSKDVFEYIVEHHTVILSPYIFKELKEKLIKKLGFSKDEYLEIEGILRDNTIIVPQEGSKLKEFSDKKDLPILNLCLTAKANLLLTGDKQIRKLKRMGETVIVSPSDFWDIEKRD